MFGLDVGTAVLASFVSSEEDYAAGFFGVALKHDSVEDESTSVTPLRAMARVPHSWLTRNRPFKVLELDFSGYATRT